MAVLTRERALGIIGRAYGADVAESLAGRLPDRIELDSPADAELLFRLGITRERLVNAMGGEL